MKHLNLLTCSLFVSFAAAHVVSPYFPGYGFSWYKPVCGYACYNAISEAMLACTTMDHSSGHSHMSGPTSPECRASDTPFLTTLAYCMNTTCNLSEVPVWQIQKYWETQVTGDAAVLPKWSYTRALDEVKQNPTIEYNASSHDIMDQTVLVSKEDYEIQSRFMVMFDHLELLQTRYCLIIVTIGFSVPILLTLLGRLPFMTGLFDKMKPYLVYPSTVLGYHVHPLPWLMGNAPTIGQALYIIMFFILNLVLSCVNYSRSQPMPWGFGPKEELLAYIGYRTGHIAYALLPLLILFSGRNNFLLWITNWSHSTFLVLHRWVARIFAIQAIVHSITLLICYQGYGTYPTASKEAYWLWGIVATVLTCTSLFISHLYFRRLAYEIFLILHILLAVFIIAGCWYHVVLNFGQNFYCNWLYAACAVWFFDRVVRVLGVAKNGIRRATVTEIGSDHVRIDIQRVRWPSKPGQIGYIYFPTLNPLRPWENHPFSINSTTAFINRKHTHAPGTLQPAQSSSSSSSSTGALDTEKATPTVSEATIQSDPATLTGTTGITLIVKKNTGLTAHLKSHTSLPVLIDGPYPQSSTPEILTCDRVLLIGGGIGITGLVGWICAHPNVKLAWSVKSSAQALVGELDTVLGDLEKEIVVGQRLDVEGLVRREAEAGYDRVGVVVCGPGGMCDDVRAVVAGLGRGGRTVFELEVDAFSW